jgi:RNA polymerase sigma-70 factor (ECF subfamily)
MVSPAVEGVRSGVLATSSEARGGEQLSLRADALLARRSALGDRQAFAELVQRHGAALYRYSVRMLGGAHHAAEDALQEALTKAWLHLPSFRGEASVKTWLFRLVANECLTMRRRRGPTAVDDKVLVSIPADARSEPDTMSLATDLRDALDVALGELPWRQRASWMLREVEGLSYEEIAEILGTSVAVVRGQLHRARSNLAFRMEDWR